MLKFRLTAVLRHNTTMPGDADLALREWSALVGVAGQALDAVGLASALPLASTSCMPLLAGAFPWVAATWPAATVEQAALLLRRSAFVQEAFLEGPDSGGILAEMERHLGSAVAMAERFLRPVVVALAHNYVIESEGALPPDLDAGRVSTSVRLLLEPYMMARETIGSRRLRAAKKTTLSLSHDLHIYKAKFFPRMVRALINIYGHDMTVFDPYCGSGTALLEAALLGQDAVGVDIDPICEMISRSKIAPFLSSRTDVREALLGFREAIAQRARSDDFVFPEELRRKIQRRDRIDGTDHLPRIVDEASILATAVRAAAKEGAAADLIRTLASDAVTKKVRYRFIGVGNGKYTIELTKKPLLDRLDEKIRRSLQLVDVFADIKRDLRVSLGDVRVAQGDARSEASWPHFPARTFTVTSPPYLPASSGREHYASSRALAFSVLGFSSGEDGYFDSGDRAETLPVFDDAPEAGRLMAYLMSDANDDADPQRDAMRFERKAVPTAHYLADIARFGDCLRRSAKQGRLAMVVADRHTFYSHQRSEIEHVVDCAPLYGEIMDAVGLVMVDEIELQLLKSSASRAKPRSTDDYHEAVLLFEWVPAAKGLGEAADRLAVEELAGTA